LTWRSWRNTGSLIVFKRRPMPPASQDEQSTIPACHITNKETHGFA